jgi:hypothetical protein
MDTTISWTSLSEANNLPSIYVKLKNYILSKFEGWQLSHQGTYFLQLRLYAVNRWWSERCFPLVASQEIASEAYRLRWLVPPFSRWTRLRFVSCRDLMIGPDHRSDRGALSQVCEHSLSTKGSHLMFIRLIYQILCFLRSWSRWNFVFILTFVAF